MQNRRLNQKGVTLVEVMIALVILLIVFMGLIQASILSINHNLRNEIRDEATRISSEYMSAAKSTQTVDTLAKNGAVFMICNPAVPCVVTTATDCNATTATPSRVFRNLSQSYTVTTGGCFIDATYSNAQVTITVSYTDPGDTTLNTLTVNSIVRRQ